MSFTLMKYEWKQHFFHERYLLKKYSKLNIHGNLCFLYFMQCRTDTVAATYKFIYSLLPPLIADKYISWSLLLLSTISMKIQKFMPMIHNSSAITDDQAKAHGQLFVNKSSNVRTNSSPTKTSQFFLIIRQCHLARPGETQYKWHLVTDLPFWIQIFNPLK